MEGEERSMVQQRKTVSTSRDGEAYRGPRTLQHGRAALPLTGSPGNTLIHETAKKEHAPCYTHTHTLVYVLMMGEWDVIVQAT